MRPHRTRSLSAHLRAAEDHSALPFHPSCPVCRRDRLVGSLDGEEVVSRRTQAAIAAGLLAFSSGGVSAAVASPRDEVIEGTTDFIPGDDWSTDVDFDPGGESDQLQDEAPATSGAPTAPTTDADDSGPLEQEHTGDTEEPVERPTPAPPANSEPATAEPEPSRAVAAPSPATNSHKTESRGSEARHAEPAGGRNRERRTTQNESLAHAPRPIQKAVADPPPNAPVATTPSTTVRAAEPESVPVAVRVVVHTSTERAAKGKRFHIVKQGESLWSIAADVLGEDATSARVAREVQRLWELNDERIGTGQPDLLFAGTRLRLR